MRVTFVIGAALAALVPQVALARPTAPQIVCQVYPTAVQCRGSVVACTTCHSAAPQLNSYGVAVSGGLARAASFEDELPAALATTETADSDEDGRTNAEELAEGTWPGNAASAFAGPEVAASEADPLFVLRRLSVAFCGRSPTFEEAQSLAEAADPQAYLHERLEECLQGDYWRREALVHIGDPLVRALAALGSCEQAFLDFEPDYNLFLWAMTDDHDARELLTAQYLVEQLEDGSLRQVESLPSDRVRAGVQCRSLIGPGVVGQNVQKPYRAGMLTTANYLLNNTQGTYLPRVSAGIAYRSWFGADIAQYEALYSVPGEPRDIDKKGLSDPVCVSCHATLDPLSYAYAYYYGAGTGSNFGSYARDRPEVYLGGLGATREIMDDWYNDQPVPHLFGQPFEQEYQLPADTSSLVLMAEKASQSDLFARHLTRLIFKEAVGGEPEPRDADEFVQLWQGLRANDFSINRLCHLLIDTRAFGGAE